MYTIAGKFTDKKDAKRVYTAVNNFVKKQQFDAYVSRLQSGKAFYVGLIYDGEIDDIPTEITETLHRLLSQGQISRLPPEAVEVMQQERKAKQKREEERRMQQAFLEDPAAYLAALEERWAQSGKRHDQ